MWIVGPYPSVSSGIKPVSYAVSLGNNQLATGDTGEPVVLSATSAGEPWFLVPDDRPISAEPGTTRYIMISAKETFLVKAVDTDRVSTSTERADALSFEIHKDADRGAYKLVSDGLVLTGYPDGKVELRPDLDDKAEQWLWQLTPTAGAPSQLASSNGDPNMV